MQNKWFAWTIGGLLVVGLAIVGVLVVNGGGRRGPVGASVTLAQAAAPVAQDQPAQSDAVQIVGAYNGSVKLNVTVAGVYSDTLATPSPGAGTPAPPDLGSIDLSVQFSQNGSALSGYVSLDRTLVYSVEHTLGTGVKIGPYLSGVLNNATMTVQSEQVSLAVSGRAVQRQFRLVSTNIANDGAQVSGEYRETLWGYTNYPITVIGDFTLQRLGSDAIVPVAGVAAPNVGADTTATTQGAAVTINVLSNDSAVNGGTLTILSVSKPQFGTATTDGKTVTYTPNAGFSGTDTFSYVVSDGKGGISTGFVTVTVNGPGGPNQPPNAAADSVGTFPGTAITINVLSNDSDPNGDTLSIVIDSPPSHGTAVVQNGQIVYTPQAGFTGIDSFTYIVSDGRGGTATAKVTINVTSTGQPPTTKIYLPHVAR